MKKIYVLIVVFGVLSGAQQLKASGFAVFAIGARAAALAEAFVAHADDASAIYYNPAGIAFLQGFRAKTNILFSSKTTTASFPASGTTYKSDLLFIRGAHFLTWSMFDRLSLGIGLFNPYIARTQWMIENPYSYQTEFSVYYLRPVVAFKLLNGLSIGFGIDFIISTLIWTHTEWYQGVSRLYRVNSRYDVKGNGLGFTAGFLWKIGHIFQFGGRYQHSVDANLSGKHIYQKVYMYPVSSVNSSVTLPSEYVLGLKFAPVAKLALCFDLHWNRWSQTKGWQFQFDRDKDERDPGFYAIWGDFLDKTIASGNQNAKLQLKDTLNLKFGLEYWLNDRFALRAGYSYQPSAVAEGAVHPIDPDLDRNIISLGFGYEGPMFSIWDRDEVRNILSFDFYIQYVLAKAQASSIPDFNPVYDNDHLIIGGGLGFKF